MLRKCSLLLVSLLVLSSGVLLPSLPAISAEYREMNPTFVELLGTLPAFFTMLTVLVSPQIAKKVGYKRTVQAGLILLFISGISPIFLSSFWFLFVTRISFGIGVGLFHPLLFTFSSQLYTDKERSDMIGYQSAFEGMGGIITSFAVAALMAGGWRHTLWNYAIIFPIFLLFTFFVPDIHPKEQVATKEKGSPHVLDRSFFLYLVLLFLLVSIYMSISVKLTALLLERGVGSARDSSNALALMGFGAMGAGFLFGKMSSLFKRWLLPLAFTFLALSLVGLAYSQEVWFVMAMCLLAGFSFRTFVPFLLHLSSQTKDGSAERRTSLLLAVFNIGSAFAPLSIHLFQKILSLTTVVSLFQSEAILTLMLAILMTMFTLRRS